MTLSEESSVVCSPKEILPQLNDLTVDLPLSRSEDLDGLITPWLDSFDADPSDPEGNRHFYEKGDRIYLFDVQYLQGRKREVGYQLIITDDTLDRAYINLINEYNNDLEKQVAEKTAHIVGMHDNLILSMAVQAELKEVEKIVKVPNLQVFDTVYYLLLMFLLIKYSAHQE